VIGVNPALPMSDKITRLERGLTRRSAQTGARTFNLSALHAEFTELTVRFEADLGALWCMFNHTERPCFTPRLLDQIRALQTRLEEGLAGSARSADMPLRSVIWTSAVPGIWNLGGDLALFTRLIREGAEAELRRYAYTCVDAVYNNLIKGNLPFLTIAMVHGDALGGGFETVLSCDVVIAERTAKFGLPEILFNLFPGMGAYSLLARRIGMRAAEEFILSGKVLPATELHKMGIVDVLATDGQGETAVRNWIAKNAKRRNGMQAVFNARQFIHPVTREELDGIVGLWVDAALRLTERDLKMMARLVRAQSKRLESSGVTPLDAGPVVHQLEEAAAA
jgi:DSF synthase